MTDIWVVAFVKATVVTAMAACADLTLRHASAGVRHLVWLTASAALFLLPFGALVPDLTLSAPIVMQAAGSISSLSAPPGLRSPLPFFVWIAGCALLLARVVASGVSIARLVHRAQPAGHPVRVTYGVRVPFACGFGRELVLVPPAFEAWPENRRRAVLLHETAHLERRDNWSLLLAEIVRAFYWPNPLVWYAAARLRREQEHAADDSVLRAGIDAAEYAAHLIDIARGQRAPLLLAGAAMRSELASRVEAVLDPKRRRSVLTKRVVLASVAALLLIVLPLAAFQSGRKAYRVGEDGVTSPVLTHKVEPEYTPEAKEAKIEGTVQLTLTVETDGHVYDVNLVKGLDAGLDANAVAAVSAWRFKPGEKAGQPVPVKAKVEITFRLR